jgi:hypothetical protein
VVGERDVIAPDVVLPFVETNDAAQDVSRVDANAHVHIDARLVADRFDGGDHREPHMDAVDGVVGARDGKSGNAVITVAEDFDSQAMVLLRQLVEAREEVVESAHEFGGRERAREGREVHDIGVQERHVVVALDIEFVEALRGFVRAVGSERVLHSAQDSRAHFGRDIRGNDGQEELFLLLALELEANPFVDESLSAAKDVFALFVEESALKERNAEKEEQKESVARELWRERERGESRMREWCVTHELGLELRGVGVESREDDNRDDELCGKDAELDRERRLHCQRKHRLCDEDREQRPEGRQRATRRQKAIEVKAGGDERDDETEEEGDARDGREGGVRQQEGWGQEAQEGEEEEQGEEREQETEGGGGREGGGEEVAEEEIGERVEGGDGDDGAQKGQAFARRVLLLQFLQIIGLVVGFWEEFLWKREKTGFPFRLIKATFLWKTSLITRKSNKSAKNRFFWESAQWTTHSPSGRPVVASRRSSRRLFSETERRVRKRRERDMH